VRSRLSRGLRANSGDPEAEDVKPLILIQDCMRAANVRLAEGIEVLMAQEEERLRREIKQVTFSPPFWSHIEILALTQPAVLLMRTTSSPNPSPCNYRRVCSRLSLNPRPLCRSLMSTLRRMDPRSISNVLLLRIC